MPDRNIIDKIINAVLKVLVPDKIILFGSQARGDARPNSDYDILVIKSGIENGSKIEGDIYEKLFYEDFLASVDVLVATPEIVEQYKDSLGCVLKPALKEGILIYGG
ncbi:MAG: nucleotidyltransferase domain-containing protein [bacterium]